MKYLNQDLVEIFLELCLESAGTLLGNGSPLGVYEMVSLEGLSKCALQIDTFLKFAESFAKVS